jgi:hypothetical protein
MEMRAKVKARRLSPKVTEILELQSESEQELEKKSLPTQDKAVAKTVDSTEDSDSSESDSSSESEEDEIMPKTAKGATSPPPAQTAKSNFDLLLDFDGGKLTLIHSYNF